VQDAAVDLTKVRSVGVKKVEVAIEHDRNSATAKALGLSHIFNRFQSSQVAI
jgi:hypothetical protein